MHAHYRPTLILLSSFVLLHLLSSPCLAAIVPYSTRLSSLSRRRVLGVSSDTSIEARDLNSLWQRPRKFALKEPHVGLATTLPWNAISLVILDQSSQRLSLEQMPLPTLQNPVQWLLRTYTVVFLDGPRSVDDNDGFKVYTVGVLGVPKHLFGSKREVERFTDDKTGFSGIALGQVTVRSGEPIQGLHRKYSADYASAICQYFELRVDLKSFDSRST